MNRCSKLIYISWSYDAMISFDKKTRSAYPSGYCIWNNIHCVVRLAGGSGTSSLHYASKLELCVPKQQRSAKDIMIAITWCCRIWEAFQTPPSHLPPPSHRPTRTPSDPPACDLTNGCIEISNCIWWWSMHAWRFNLKLNVKLALFNSSFKMRTFQKPTPLRKKTC